MSETAVRKRVLILSDSDDLSRAIALGLDGAIDVVYSGSLSAGNGREHACWEEFDLIVLGASQPGSEPAAMLHRRGLDERIDCVPLLIISPRAFFSDPGERIFWLAWPFNPSILQTQVLRILNGKGG